MLDERVCNITSWSVDGFGHQLHAILTCQALSLINASYRYVPSVHTRVEHGPKSHEQLLAFLNEVSGPREEAIQVPVKGAGGRYMGRYRTKRCESCDPICDMCAPKWAEEPRVRVALRTRAVATLHRFIEGFRCIAADAICVHMRRRDWADLGDLDRRLVPDEFYVSAVQQLYAMLPPGTPVFVATNGNVSEVRRLFGDRGASHTPRVFVHGPEAFLLTQLAQFVHCCAGLVLSASSLSDAIGILSTSRLVVRPSSNAELTGGRRVAYLHRRTDFNESDVIRLANVGDARVP